MVDSFVGRRRGGGYVEESFKSGFPLDELSQANRRGFETLGVLGVELKAPRLLG